jgi:hypothetical protein
MNTPSNTTPDQATTSTQTRRRWLRILLATVLAVGIASLAGGTAWSHHLTSHAREDYATAVQAQESALARLTDTATEATTLLTNSKDKTAEEQPRTDLAESLDKAEALSASSTVDVDQASRGELEEATLAAAQRTQQASDLTASIATQMQAVTDSMSQKALADAESALTQHIALLQQAAAEARAAIDDSSGKVADDQVRVDAESARTNGLNQVEKAQKLLNTGDLQALQAMSSTLADAHSDLVAKTKAVSDAQAAWQQAQEVAPADAPSDATTPTVGNGETYSGYSTDTTGGTWAPAPSDSGSSGGGGAGGGSDFPQTMTDPDGHVHHQITPDPDGSYTDDLGEF